jgi:hypothetical protein
MRGAWRGEKDFSSSTQMLSRKAQALSLFRTNQPSMGMRGPELNSTTIKNS